MKTDKIRLKKLLDVIDQLKDGHILQTHTLHGVMPLVGTPERGRYFYQYLLHCSYRHFCNGQSLAQKTVIPDKTKKSLYEKIITQLILYSASGKSAVEAKKQLLKCIRFIDNFSSGHVRISQRASRYDLPDADLVFLMMLIHRYLENEFTDWWLFWLVQHYCTDYKNLRFKLNCRSIPRIWDVMYFYTECSKLSNL